MGNGDMALLKKLPPPFCHTAPWVILLVVECFGGCFALPTTNIPPTATEVGRSYINPVLMYVPPECVVDALSPDREWVFCTVYAPGREMAPGHWARRLDEGAEWNCLLCGKEFEGMVGDTRPVEDWPGMPLKYGLVVSNTIWLIDLLNPGQRDRISAGEGILYAIWAPDGSAIAAVMRDYRLLLVATDGSGHRILAEGPEIFSHYGDLVWSPDGQRLYITKLAADTWGKEVWSIEVRNGESRKIFERDSVYLMLLTINRQGILLCSEPVHDQGIEKIRFWVLEGNKVVGSVSIEGHAIYGKPIWSPDDRKVAVLVASRNGVERLVEVDITSGRVRTVPWSEHMKIARILSWQPEGIIVATHRGTIELIQISE